MLSSELETNAGDILTLASCGVPSAASSLQMHHAGTPEEWNSPQLVQVWRRLLESSKNPNALHQSPEWFLHLGRRPEVRDRLSVLTVRRSCGEVLAIVPLLKDTLRLDIAAAGRTLLRNRLPIEVLLGHEPLVVDEPDVLQHLVRYLLFDAANAIHCRMLRLDSPFYHRLLEVAATSRRGCLYDFEGPGLRHLLNLPTSAEQYFAQFTKKKQYNLKRQIRQLTEAVGGALTLRRFTECGDVATFLEHAASVSAASWQSRVTEDLLKVSYYWRDELSSLAAKGMLRCYVLYAGQAPCAFVVGIHSGSTFHFDTTAYVPALHAYSPGTAILCLMIEDLLVDPHGIERLSFGFGDQEYKRTFGNESIPVVEILAYRSSMVTQPRLALHRAYRRGVATARRLCHGVRK